MASKQEYSRISMSDGSSEDSVLHSALGDDEALALPAPKATRFRRLPYILAFVLGTLVGIALMVASQRMTKTPATVFHTHHDHYCEQAKAEHARPEDASTRGGHPAGHDATPNTLQAPYETTTFPPGFVINPKTGDAKCGETVQEAKANGCHYDVLTSRWLSDECFNGEVLDQMLSEADFVWFEDPQHTKPVAREVVMAGEFDRLWPMEGFHVLHCLYLWRRLHSAVVQHRHIDEDTYSYEHTMHCTRLIMEWPKGKSTTTVQMVGVPYCLSKPL